MERGKARNPPSTATYDCDRPSDDQTGGGWWRGNLASRLLYGGATKIFPSFFSRSSTESKQDDAAEGSQEFHDVKIARTTEGGQVLVEAEASEGCFSMDVCAGSTLHGTSDGPGISEIEHMLKGKALSREDFHRLTGILQSRIAVQSDVDESGRRNSDVTTRVEAVVPLVGPRNFKCPENEAAHLNRVIGDGSNHFLHSTSRDLVDASPVDIAKKYMGARTSELGGGSQNEILKEETTPLPASLLPNISVPSPTPKPLICWPGALVHHGHSYVTPRTERGRVGLHTSRRTPYSRVHSSSRNKLEGIGDQSRNILSTNVKQLQTPVFGDSQVAKTRISSYNDGFGSVGPMRRIPRKFHGSRAPSKGMYSSPFSASGPSWDESFDASNNSLSMLKQNVGPGASTSSREKLQPVDVKAPTEVDSSTVHSPSSDIARKILEHLDRAVPTPEKTSEELKLATSWRKRPASESSTSTVEALVGNPFVESFESQWSSHALGQKFFSQEKEVRANSHPVNQPEQRNSDEPNNTVNTKQLTSSILSSEVFSERGTVLFNAKRSTEFRTADLKVNKNQVAGNQQVGGKSFPSFSCGDDHEALDLPKKRSTRTFGNKPPLTSISITKSDSKSRGLFDNGSSFTFPVSASSASVLEPPTPSIMPSSADLLRPKETKPVPANSCSLKNGGPSYSFGSKNSGRSLVFSFPCSSSSIPSDKSTPTFTFGSDKARLSFRSGEDAVCS